MTPAFRIRPPLPSDQAFVASTWVSNLASMGTQAHQTGHVIDRLLDDQRTKLLIACDVKHEHVIHGWLCYAPIKQARLIHYIYSRKGNRKHGIAHALIAAAGLADDRPLWWTMKGPSGDELLGKMRTTTVHVPVTEYLGA